MPMLSMDLEGLSEAERTVVRRWSGFYAAHVERFQRDGRWRVDYRNGVAASLNSHHIARASAALAILPQKAFCYQILQIARGGVL